MFIQALSLSPIAPFGGLTLSHSIRNGQQSEVNVFPFVIQMVLSALALGLYRGNNRHKKKLRQLSVKASTSWYFTTTKQYSEDNYFKCRRN